MNKKNQLLLSFIYFVLVFSSCKNDPEKINNPEDLLESYEISTDFIAEEDDLIALLEDNSVICVDYAARLRNEYFIYRYYYESNDRVDIGYVKNFVMTYGRPIICDDDMYLFIASSDSSAIKNNLYCINLNDNKMDMVFENNDSYPLSPISSMSGDLYFLSLDDNMEEDIVYSHISTFNAEMNQAVSRIEKYMHHSDGGEILVSFSACNNELYALTQINQNDEILSVIDVYDSACNMKKRLYFSETFGDIQSDQKITKFYVMGDYIFIRSTSGGFIGKIEEEDTIAAVLSDPGLEMAFNADNLYEEKCVFYIMRTSDLYILSMKEDTLVQSKLPSEENRVIKLILSNKDGYIIHDYLFDESGREQNPNIIYYDAMLLD